MNRLKRVLCIILLCCLTFSVPSQAAVPLDVTEDGLLEMLRALSCLGILYDMDSGGNFRPDDTVTRGEAALSAVQLLGIHVSGYTESDVAFTDVTDETPNHEAIRAAVVHGLLDGFGDGTFRPDDSITYEQMAKILVCALGYEPMAELTGGYPTGYLIQANDLDLFLGIQQMGAENLKRRDLAAMLFHALHAPMLLEVGYEGDSPKVIKDNSRTLLTERLHCVWGEGVVQANSYTSIYESVGVGNRRVQIGDLLFDVGETDVASMVGMYVTFYASENENGGYTIIGAWADDTRLLTLDAREIVKEETSFRELACDMDGRIRRYRLSDAPYLIYNSTAAPLEDVSMLAPDAGTVILSDTDANGDFDVILVTAFQTHVADVISGSRITFKDGSQPLDLEESDWAIDICKNGAPASINEIAAWDVVQIAAPKYGNYGLCLVEVTDRKAGGNVTALSEDMIEIAGEEYTIAKEYASEDISILKAGQNVIGLLDRTNRLVEVQRLSTSETTALLYNVKLQGGLDNRVAFELFDANGAWIQAFGAENMKINGIKMEEEEIYSIFLCQGDAYGIRVDEAGLRIDMLGRYIDFENGDPTGAQIQVATGVPGTQPFQKIVNRQMIRYRLTDNGEIAEIQTADADDAPNAFILRGNYTGAPGEKGVLQWRGGAARGWFLMDNSSPYAVAYGDEDTTIFRVPLDYPDEKQNYAVQKGSSLPESDLTFSAKLYGFRDDEPLDGVPVVLTTAGDEILRTYPVVIDKVVSALDDNGDTVYKVYCYENGQLVEYIAEEEAAIRKTNGNIIKTGDFLEFNKNSDGTIKNLHSIYDGDILINVDIPLSEQKGSFGGYRDDSQTVAGELAGVNAERMRLMIDTGETNATGQTPVIGLWRTWTTSWIYLVDLERQTVQVAQIADLEIGDFACAKIRISSADAVVIYRND